MTEPTIDLLSGRLALVEARCLCLERRARRWRWAGGLAVSAAALLVLGGARSADGPKSIMAEDFIMVDKEGKMRAWLAAGPDGKPLLQFYDDEGKSLINMGLSPKGLPYLNFRGTGPKGGITLGMLGKDMPSICFNTNDGKTRISLGIDPEHPQHLMTFTLTDPKGKPRVLIEAAEDGTPAIHLLDADGKPVSGRP